MLLERSGELASLGDLFIESRASGQLVLIGGEAGAGKSTLVEAFCAGSDASVLIGHCDDLFAPRPLGPLADIARDTGGPLRVAIDAGDAPAAFDAFLDVLADARRPCIVVLEDLQWADDATLDLLRFVARRLDRGRALVIATYRDELPPEHPLRQTMAGLNGSNVHRLALPPLSVEAVRSLVGDRAIDPIALHRATAGNPFYVVEVLAAERWMIPTSVREAVLTRAARLDRPSRDALDATAVLGNLATSDAVMRVAGCTPEALERCVAVGLLSDEENLLAFRHDLSRVTIEDAITPWRRRALHLAALDAVADVGDVVVLAHHAIAAGDATSIVRLAPAAAERSRALGAHRAAAALYGSALRHSAALCEADRIALYEAHARACAAVGDEEASRRSAQVVLAHLRDVGDVKPLAAWLSWCATSASCTGMYAAEGRALAREAVGLLSPLGDSPELAEALGAVAGQCLLVGPQDETIELSTRSLRLAEQFGNHDLAVRMMAILGATLGSSDDARGIDMLRSSLVRAQELDSAIGIARAANNLAATMDALWRPFEALEYIEIAYRVAIANELVYHPAFVRQEQATAESLLGRWDAAVATASAVIADDELDDAGRSIALATIAHIRTRRGEPDVESVLAEAERLARESSDLQVVHPVRIARTEDHWFDGNLAGARDQVTMLIEAHRTATEPWRFGELALWCSRLDRTLPFDRPVAEPFALHIAGRHAEAADAFDERHCPYSAADALGDSASEDELRRSLDILYVLGAGRRAAQVAARLRELGVQRIPRGPRSTTRSNGAGLTVREAEVAGLLAQGMTNGDIAERLVISPKTVDHHVTAVLAKLGVGNRRAVAAALDSISAE